MTNLDHDPSVLSKQYVRSINQRLKVANYHYTLIANHFLETICQALLHVILTTVVHHDQQRLVHSLVLFLFADYPLATKCN